MFVIGDGMAARAFWARCGESDEDIGSGAAMETYIGSVKNDATMERPERVENGDSGGVLARDGANPSGLVSPGRAADTA
jgi:hypothetical protein